MNQILRYQFTVDDFARMVEAGIFSEDDRVELIDGEVRIMSPTGARHAGIIKRIIGIFRKRLNLDLVLGVHDPIQLDDYTEPQPDISVSRPRHDFYEQSHPGPADILLVIEVADSSLAYDRDEKIPRYARAPIPEAWLVDLAGETLAQYSAPREGEYREVRLLRSGDRLVSAAVQDLELGIDEIFAISGGV